MLEILRLTLLFLLVGPAGAALSVDLIGRIDRNGTDFSAMDATPTGDLIAVGDEMAFNDDGVQTGAVFIYRKRSGASPGSFEWVEEAKFTSSTGNDRFGASVALREDLLVVGAPQVGRQDGTRPYGAVYVYAYREVTDANGASFAWELQDQLAGAKEIYVAFGSGAERFGARVHIGEDDTIFVGAPVDTFRNFGDIEVTADGDIYVFEKNTTTNNSATAKWVKKTNHFTLGSGSKFGRDFAVDGNLLVATADGGVYGDSKVYVYRGFTNPSTVLTFDFTPTVDWSFEDNLTPEFKEGGYRVRISGTTVAFLSGFGAFSGIGSVFELNETSAKAFGTRIFYEWAEAAVFTNIDTGKNLALHKNLLIFDNVIYSKISGSWIRQTVLPVTVSVQQLHDNLLLATDSTNDDLLIFSISGQPSQENNVDNQQCADKDENCETWALSGECDKNPAYMTEGRMCLFSCGRCDLARDDSTSSSSAPVFGGFVWISTLLLVVPSLIQAAKVIVPEVF